MKGNKTQNPFSPHFSKDKTSPITFSKKGNTTPRQPKSPLATDRRTTSPNNLIVSNIPEIQKIKVISKLTLGKDKMVKIKNTLSLEEECKRNFQNRKRTNNYFFKYQPHSFSISKEGTETKSLEKMAKENAEKYQAFTNKTLINAVNALNDLRDKPTLRQFSKSIDKKQGLASQLLRKMRRIKKEKEEAIIQKEQKENENYLDVSPYINDIVEKISPFEELDNIVAIKEDSFFRKKIEHEDIDIFQFRQNPNARCFMSGWEQLTQHNFSFDSINALKNKKINEQIQKGLSTYSRISAINGQSKSIVKSFKLQISELFMVPNELILKDILLLASGQVLPSYLRNINKDYVEMNVKVDDPSLLDISNIPYKDKIQHKNTDLNQQNNRITELIDYFRMPLTKKEIKASKMSDYWMQKLQQTIGALSKIKTHRIEDKVLQKNWQLQKEQVLLSQLRLIKNSKEGPKEMEKKIRMNKVNKDKTERLKLNVFNLSVQENNNFQKKIKSKSAKKGEKKA